MARHSAYTVVAKYYLSRLARKPLPTLSAVASRSHQVTGHHWVTPPSILHKDAHLSRILGGDNTPEVLIRDCLLRTRIELRPCIVHEFTDAWLVDGSAYLGRALRMELRNRFEPRSRIRNMSIHPGLPYVEMDAASLISTVAGSSWFGHWLMDEVPMQMLAVQFAPGIGHIRSRYVHEADYLRALDLSEPRRAASAYVRNLYVVDEFAQNPHKTLRYHRARDALRRRAPKPDGRRIFLKRGTAGQSRIISNEDALADRLSREGFTILEIARATLQELRDALLSAAVMVSVEGSHLDHALYLMPAGAALVILNPPARFMTTVADIAIFCGIDCAIFCCEAQDPSGTTYVADEDELMKFIEETLIRVRQRADQVQEFVGSVIDLIPQDERNLSLSPRSIRNQF